MVKKAILPAAIRGRYAGEGKITQRLEIRPDLCTNTLTGVQKDNVLIEICESEESDMKIVCERRCDEGVRFFRDNVCGTIRTIDGGGDKRVIECKSAEDITMLGGLQAHQIPRSDGICPCVNSAVGMGGGQTPIAIRPNYRVRKLTQKECWRLMGFTDDDFDKAQAAMNENIYGGNDRSGSQLYKQAGNSIVVDVLCAIMGELYQAMPYLFEDIVVGSFFSGIGAFEKALSTFDSVPVNDEQNQIIEDGDLRQIGYINNYNGDANRVYDSDTVARVLKAEAGGGGAKTGWYKVPTPPDV